MNLMHSQGPSTSMARAWGIATGPTRGPRPKLSADRIAEHAVALADEEGLEGLTLARVAERCGVVTTALYRYVAAKADVIDLMAEHALRDPPRIDPAAPESVGDWIAAFGARLHRHPWLSDIQPRGVPMGPQGLGWLDLLIRILDRRGVADVAGVALQLSTTVRAYAAMESSLAQEPPPMWWQDAVARRYPALAAAFAERDLTSPAGDLAAAIERILGGPGKDRSIPRG